MHTVGSDVHGWQRFVPAESQKGFVGGQGLVPHSAQSPAGVHTWVAVHVPAPHSHVNGMVDEQSRAFSEQFAHSPPLPQASLALPGSHVPVAPLQQPLTQ